MFRGIKQNLVDCPRVVVCVRVSTIDQKELFKKYLY